MNRTRSILVFVGLILGCLATPSYTNPVPPPVVSVCDLSDKWLEKFIEIEGTLTHFHIASDSQPATPDLKLTSNSCTGLKPILVTLTYCGRCECWETRSEDIWDVIKRLRASNVKS